MKLNPLLPLLAMLLIAGASLAQPSDPPTSMEELRRLYESGDYPAAIRGITRLTSLRSLPDGFDLVSLWNLKAECHLRLKQTPLAIDAFDNAANAATDDRARAIADTSARLVRKASAFNYRPRTAEPGQKPEPIDVVEPASRERAIQAFFVDELNDAKSDTARAAKAAQLPRLFRAIEALAPLRNTELAATGEDTEYRALRDQLIQACTTLMNDALVKMNTRVGEIARSARTRTTARDGTFTYRGLSGQERLDLQQTMQTCEQISSAVEELHPQAGDELREQLDMLRGDARTVHALADATLNRDYTGRYREAQ